MAEQTVDQMVRFLGGQYLPCETAGKELLPTELTKSISGLTPPKVSRTIVEHFCQNEWAVELSDILIRRTSWCHYHENHLQLADQVAVWMADVCGWGPDQLKKQILAYKKYMKLAAPWRHPDGSLQIQIGH